MGLPPHCGGATGGVGAASRFAASPAPALEQAPDSVGADEREDLGAPETGIARMVGIDAPTLRALYAEELENGLVKANTKVAENLYRKATGEGREAVGAAIFWLKARAGWRETTTHEIAGRGGAPIRIEITGADALL